jgi:hypothetical protein
MERSVSEAYEAYGATSANSNPLSAARVAISTTSPNSISFSSAVLTKSSRLSLSRSLSLSSTARARTSAKSNDVVSANVTNVSS